MKYYGEKLPINGVFLIGHINIWKKLVPLYKSKLELCKNYNYAHDEETILYLLWKENKNLFYDIEKYEADNFNISLKYGACFIHIPKCGGTTIEKLLFNENNIRNGKLPCSVHSTISEFKNFYSFFIFSFVRNPYTRIISVFNYYMNNGNGTNKDKNMISNKKTITLNNFLDLYSKDNIPHLNTQFYYLKNSEHINYIAKFENYDNELNYILSFIQYKNKNKNYVSYRKSKQQNHLITPNFINKVNEIYAVDFKNYNYKMITLKDSIYYFDFLKLINV